MFDFEENPDQIDRVEVLYNRVVKIGAVYRPEDAIWGFARWEYKETLIIDRKSETLEIRNKIGEGCEITHTYHAQDGVEELLDDIDPGMLNDRKRNSPDAVTDPMETKTYEIKVITQYGTETSISGTYDKNGLPSAWPEFIELLQEFVAFYSFPGEMFSENCFGKRRRREGEIIFCDVTFDEGGKTYCYIADTDEFSVGDLVVYVDGNWTSSSLLEASELISKKERIEYYEKNDKDSMAARKVVAHVRFWDSSRDYDIILND